MDFYYTFSIMCKDGWIENISMSRSSVVRHGEIYKSINFVIFGSTSVYILEDIISYIYIFAITNII